MKTYIYIIMIGISSCLLMSCESSKHKEQKALYEKVARADHQNTYPVIEGYRKVINIDPTSDIAEKAQNRIDAIQVKMEMSRRRYNY